MNISFQNQANRIETHTANHGDPNETGKTRKSMETVRRPETEGVHVTFFAGEGMQSPFGNLRSDSEEKKQCITQLQEEASLVDVGISQDYMILMSNTLSEEDYHKLEENGFDLSAMDPTEAVTIVDKIKAELVRSGQQIVGYTDDIDLGQLADALGSETLARALQESFQAADVPVTAENTETAKKAWELAEKLVKPEDGTYQYMVDNELEPEIWNFYLAQNSGAGAYQGQNSYLHGDNAFYVDEQMQKQIDQVLEQAGYEANEEHRNQARWLLDRNLPLTAENIQRLNRLQNVVLPVTEEMFAKAAAKAIASGKDPIHGSLSAKALEQGSIYEKAVQILEEYQEKDAQTLNARKQLEEIRLHMTAEVNVKLLKSGFSIDTAPMEELIDALKEAEKTLAGQYFPGEDAAVSVAKYADWNQTNRVVEEIPALPAGLLGTVRLEEEGMTLTRFHEQGVSLKQSLDMAGTRYEELMTVPRADLGDGLLKAFGNLDDLLENIGLEAEPENRKAARILAYNQMEISEANVERVKDAYTQVSELIRKMTPATTLQMIRDGVNPLESSFEQLNAYFDKLPADYKKETESYSRYLYGLEQNGQITEEERESYIGVYRLLHQIERRDGAAIGGVLNEQAGLQFTNLLSVIRSRKFGHMDVRAGDELGTLKELVQKGGASISEQIQRNYDALKLSEMRQCVHTDEQVVRLLEQGELVKSADNLLAAEKLLQKKTPFDMTGKKKLDLWEKLADKDSFRQAYTELLDDMEGQLEDTTVLEAKSSLDVWSMQIAHRQLSIMGKLANKEEYFLSMEMGEQEALVHLTIENKAGKRSGLKIAVDYGEDEHVEAHLEVKQKTLEGFLLGKTDTEVRKLQEVADIFYNLINENASVDLEAGKLPVVSSENAKMTRMSEINSREDEIPLDNGMLYRVAKLFLQAMR